MKNGASSFYLYDAINAISDLCRFVAEKSLAHGANEKRARLARAFPVYEVRQMAYFKAASVISCVKAPSGSLVMTGSEPPFISEATVRL